MRIKYARFRARRRIDNIRFQRRVPSEQREEAIREAREFISEAMDFLRKNPDKLKPIRPDRTQMGLLYLLFESIEAGGLTLAYRNGKIREDNGRPCIIELYRAMSRSSERRQELVLHLEREVSLNVQVEIGEGDRRLPRRFSVYGRIGLDVTSGASFLGLPEKAESPEQVGNILGIGEREDFSVGVYGNGERIVINSWSVDGKEEGKITEQYYLLGAFKGEKTGEFWLYGCNQERDFRVSVKRREGAGQLAPQWVEVRD